MSLNSDQIEIVLSVFAKCFLFENPDYNRKTYPFFIFLNSNSIY